MKSIAIILLFLGLAICLGAAYVFMPKDAAVSDPQFTAQISQRVGFKKEFPYLEPYRQLSINYTGETQMLVETIGFPVQFSKPALGHQGGCFGPSMSAVEPDTVITMRLLFDDGPIKFYYQRVNNYDAAEYEDRGFLERNQATLEMP